ncbi:MAG TPA: hypothetical protein VF556_17300 [Pyrinomonadaceae bacterium]|jgi:uncharacterized membrane protein
MKANGITAGILYLISFAFFMWGMFRFEWMSIAGIIGAIFFVVATIILIVMIKKRSSTRRS